MTFRTLLLAAGVAALVACSSLNSIHAPAPKAPSLVAHSDHDLYQRGEYRQLARRIEDRLGPVLYGSEIPSGIHLRDLFRLARVRHAMAEHGFEAGSNSQKEAFYSARLFYETLHRRIQSEPMDFLLDTGLYECSALFGAHTAEYFSAMSIKEREEALEKLHNLVYEVGDSDVPCLDDPVGFYFFLDDGALFRRL